MEEKDTLPAPPPETEETPEEAPKKELTTKELFPGGTTSWFSWSPGQFIR